MMIPVSPVSKPRMTQRDKWQKRPAVMRYRAFCDELRLYLKELPDDFEVVFRVPMPPSWSKKKRAALVGEPHQQKPDIDNFLKAILDAIMADDCTVWSVKATKRWAEEGSIEIVGL